MSEFFNSIAPSKSFNRVSLNDNNAASAGDWTTNEFDNILVGPGTYYENLVIQDKTVILRSTDAPDATIIDGGNLDSVLYIEQTRNDGSAVSTRPTIEGFTLTNGKASIGGGVYVRRYADPTFRDCVIRNNTAGTGGGVYAGYGVCSIILEDSLIADNHADGWGGGMYGAISCMTLRNSAVVNNTAGGSGGGVVSIGFCTGFGAYDSIIAGNAAGTSGGAIHNQGSSSCGASVRACDKFSTGRQLR